MPHDYWEPGTHVWWRYRSRRRGLPPGQPQVVHPVRVIRDDADGLVAWLAPRTPVLRTVLAGSGESPRSAGLDQQFRLPRAQGRSWWWGNGIVKIAPTGMPWSVWLFWHADGSFANWYVNLEEVHRRDERNVYTQDNVLDLVVRPDREVIWKDEDELEAAVAAGRYTAAEAAEFVEIARTVEKLVTRWDSPFCDGWERWGAEPGWPVPELPNDVVAEFVADPAE